MEYTSVLIMTIEQGFTEQRMMRPLLIESSTNGRFHVTVDSGHTIGDLTGTLGKSRLQLRSPFDITASPAETVIQAIANNHPPQVKYPSILSDTIAMTVVLPDGTIAPIRRGDYTSPPGGVFHINGITIPSPETTDYGMPITDLVDLYARPFSLGTITRATINMRPAQPSDLLVIPTFDALQTKRLLTAFKKNVPPSLKPGGISDLWYIDDKALATMQQSLNQQVANQNPTNELVDLDTHSLTQEMLHPHLNAYAMVVANVEYANGTLKNMSPLIDVLRICDRLRISTRNALIPDIDGVNLLAFLQPYLRPVHTLPLHEVHTFS